MARHRPVDVAAGNLDGAEDLTVQGRDDMMCFSGGESITWGHFAADVADLRTRIAPASHICNVSNDRYTFMVGLAAALLNGQITVLPNAAAIGAVSGAVQGCDTPLILGGEDRHDVVAPRLPSVERTGASEDPAKTLTALERADAEIHVYTSGTTSAPRRHVKTWSILAGGAAVTDAILRRIGLSPGQGVLLGTTPHQHMYGLEATIFASLAWGYQCHRGSLFYPADLEAAIAEVEQLGAGPIVLVTSPAHMKYLEPVILQSPAIKGVLSATAPLSDQQAARLEARGDLPVMEIYGSTETGSVAIRRTIEGAFWTPLAGFEFGRVGDAWNATAPHMPGPIPMSDMIDPQPDGGFRLLGRVGDMVSVRGKRTTLAALNAVLEEIAYLADGVVVHQENGGDDRLAIIAVLDPEAQLSHDQARAEIRRDFRAHLDPVFAPRRILFVDALPRGGTGKIPADTLKQLAERAGIAP